MKFKIGDKVTFKKTGCPGVGTIYGMFKLSEETNNIPPWNEQYPNWQNKALYMVKFSTPQKVASFQEYIEQMPNRETFSEDQLKLLYLNTVPYVDRANYPEDDLELLQ